ncbi:hypothetical protein SAMN05216428_102449 [Nitrosospira sp. Nsp11]|uniref:hypothetical protein n=1 Tax=Nitrosospira sp. Nsp11 TaxID=1855338 RepID=UPI000922AC22|nr:hypothetical protein [Nitrosospira sp. Nsp11]SHL45283.1 hypothetical protein SAMN05216428_102449 [Nitrosospira sp. Nsp11]
MAKGDLLGKIECPCCGTPGGMRVTEDKNGQPFGYCEATCNVQMRLGGSGYRVDQFYKKYPGVRRPGAVTVTVTGEGGAQEKPVTVTGEGGVSVKPVPVTGGKGKPVKAAIPDYLSMLGVK